MYLVKNYMVSGVCARCKKTVAIFLSYQVIKKWLVFLSPGAGYRLQRYRPRTRTRNPTAPKKNGRVSGERKKTSPTFLTGRACFFSFRRRALF
jgi:hypothetical protein